MEKFQSFGQRKSALLFLLYHTAKYIENKRSVQALILLDDFEAGLDNRRKEALDGLFSYGFQTVITGLEEKKGCDNLTLGY
jgi:recombinational DNA repair ATPase RecF